MMDSFIAQRAEDQRIASRVWLAWNVEQIAMRLGLIDDFTDANGDGPFIQEMRKYNAM